MGNDPQQIHTLCSLLENSIRHFGDRPAIASPDSTPITYMEMYASVVTLGHQLSEKGIGVGDKVAIISENCPQWAIAYFAITCIGAVAVPILPEFHSDAMAHIIRQAHVKGVLITEKLFHKIGDASFDHSPFFIEIESFSLFEQGITKDRLAEMKSAGLREFRKLKGKVLRLANRVTPPISEDDLAVIIYTSGTTGHSKGVMLSHKNILCDAKAVLAIEHVDENDRLLSVLPLPHAYECTVGLVLPMMTGALVYYLNKPPTARVLLPALASIKPTIMLTVPLITEKIYKNTILPKLTANWFIRLLYSFSFTRKIILKSAGKKLAAFFGGNLRVLVIGGAPIAADAERFLYEAQFPYVIGYGLTETSPLVSASSIARPKLFSAGPPIKGVQVRIASPDANNCGEIQVKGDNVMIGYYLMPELTEEVFTEDGWFCTGDLGSMDDEGYIYIRGRLKNVILGPSGENIYPEEIESFFFEFSLVAEVLVFMSEGRVTAKVHLDAALVDEQFGTLAHTEREQRILELLEGVRQKVNDKVSSFARIVKIIQQSEPFEKTATKKIKRYLYINT